MLSDLAVSGEAAFKLGGMGNARYSDALAWPARIPLGAQVPQSLLEASLGLNTISNRSTVGNQRTENRSQTRFKKKSPDLLLR